MAFYPDESIEILDEGLQVTAGAQSLDFVGSGVTVTNVGDAVTVTIAGGGAIGSAVTSGTAGSVLFVGSGSVLAQDNANFFWDDTNNYLGVGTAAPASKLHVVVSNKATQDALYIDGYSASADSLWNFYRTSRGTVGSPSAIQSGDGIMSLGSKGYHSGGAFSTGPQATVVTKATENWTNSARGTEFIVSTTPTGSTTLAALLTAGGAAGKGLYITAGTATTDVNALSITQTWNNAGVAFSGIELNITNSAASASSKLLDLQVGGTALMAVMLSGQIVSYYAAQSAILVQASSTNAVGMMISNTVSSSKSWSFTVTGGSWTGGGGFGNGSFIFRQSTNDINAMGIHPLGGVDFTQGVTTGSANSLARFIGVAHTALTASTEYIDVNFNLARTLQFATGALATQRAVVFQAPTYGFVGASTLTTAATVAIAGAPAAGTNATITNSYALWVQSGNSKFDDDIIVEGVSFTRKTIQVLVTDPNGDALTTGDGKAIIRIPSDLTGFNLVQVAAAVTTVSSSGSVTVMVRNVTDAQDMLSTAITIEVSEKDSVDATTQPVINTTYDDVATADQIAIDIDGAGTGAKGLIVSLTFEKP